MTKKKVENDSDNDEYAIEDIPEDLDDDVIEDDDIEEIDDDDEKEDIIIDNENETKGCMDDEYLLENQFETEIPIENNSEYISVENRISCNRLTRYEMVRILGERTKQLTMGAKP